MLRIPGAQTLKRVFHDGQMEMFRSSKSTAIALPLLGATSLVGFYHTRNPDYLKLALSISGGDAALAWAAAKFMPMVRAHVAKTALLNRPADTPLAVEDVRCPSHPAPRKRRGSTITNKAA